MGEKKKPMKLLVKPKSDVQVNGIDDFNISKWVDVYAPKVSEEFKERYNDISKVYSELLEEIKWNEIIYNTKKLKFEPVIGNDYYLYFEDNKYSLSIIAPWEWDKNYIGTFRMNYNGKWNKIENNG